MIIKRELKTATWAYNEETQELTLTAQKHIESAPDGVPDDITEEITLGRVHAFSLARFLIRVFFRMSMKKRSKTTVAATSQNSGDDLPFV